jgi:hypothetical protein
MKKVHAVVVTAFLVECDREVDSDRLRKLIRRVKDATKTFTDGEVSLIPSQAFSAFWVDNEKNLGRCKQCDNLTSDRSKPEFVGGVFEGKLASNGTFVCQECSENK